MVSLCYEEAKYCVKSGSFRSEAFSVTIDLKQGCPLASILFNLVIEWGMQQVERGDVLVLGPTRCDRLQYIDFADKIMAEAFEEMEERKIVKESIGEG